jgi:integrase
MASVVQFWRCSCRYPEGDPKAGKQRGYKKTFQKEKKAPSCPHCNANMYLADGRVARIMVRGKTITKTTSGKKAAEGFIDDVRHAAGRGLPIPGQEPSITWKVAQETFEKWMESAVRDGHLKQRTVDSMYHYSLQVLREWFGNHTMQTIQPEEVMDFRDYRRELGRAKQTCNHNVKTLKRMYSILCERYTSRQYPLLHLAKQDIAGVKMYETDNYLDRVVSDEEEVKWLKTCAVDRYRLFWIIAIESGLRTENILELTWKNHVDLPGRLIEIPADEQKGTNHIIIPMTDRLHDELQAHRKKNPFVQTVLWSKYGKDIPLQSVYKCFMTITREAGIEGISPKTLRHTAATRWVENGIPIEAVSRMLGHADISITMKRYAKVRVKFLQQQMAGAEDFKKRAEELTKLRA